MLRTSDSRIVPPLYPRLEAELCQSSASHSDCVPRVPSAAASSDLIRTCPASKEGLWGQIRSFANRSGTDCRHCWKCNGVRG